MKRRSFLFGSAAALAATAAQAQATEIVLAIAGQSNGTQMCTVPVAGCVPVFADTYVWSGGVWRPMTSSDGAGMIELANMIRAQTGLPVYIYNLSYGGSSVVPAAASPATNCWTSQDPASPLVGALAQVAAGGKIPSGVIWMQGEQESFWAPSNPSFDMVNGWKNYFDAARTFMMVQWGVTAAQQWWMVTPVGKPNIGNTKYVLQSQIIYANSTPYVWLGSARYDAGLVNDGTGVFVHMNGPSCRVFGDRLARDILAKMAVSGFGNAGPGPQIIEAWKGGTTVAILTNSTTGIVAYPGTSFLTGFQVYDYNYTTLLPIVGAWVSSGLIFLSLGVNPGDGNKVHILYQADNYQAMSSPPFDQDTVFLNWGSPLLPCYGLLTDN